MQDIIPVIGITELPAMVDAIGDLELFATIVDAGSLTAAASVLESSPPAISRRLAAMERRLGVRLAERSARRFRLTDEGRVLIGRGRPLLEALRDVEADVSTRGTQAHGLLKIGAPVELGHRHIAPLLAEFASDHPGVKAHLTLSDAGLEVGQDALDVVLRFGLPQEQSLLARKIASTRRILCAAPAYLNRRGTPTRLDKLRHHDCLLMTRRHGIPDQWSFRDGSVFRTVEITGRLSSGSGEVLHRWVLEGYGIAREAEWDIVDELAEGRLVEIMSDYESPRLDLYATFQSGRPLAPRIRLFVDFVIHRFSVTASS